MLSTMLVLAALHAPVLVATPPSCAAAIGDAQARVLVDRCLDVSPATHPPCNVLNPCDLIIDEIRRSCAFLTGTERPNFCAQYPSPP